MKVTCDECQKEFTITELREKKHPKQVIETYFQCPHCQKKYVAFVTDPVIRKLQFDIRKLQDNPPKVSPGDVVASMYVEKLKKHYAKVEKLEIEIKNKMNALKQLMALN
jgi:hypothetical protein